jgi:hypothetical protein
MAKMDHPPPVIEIRSLTAERIESGIGKLAGRKRDITKATRRPIKHATGRRWVKQESLFRTC